LLFFEADDPDLLVLPPLAAPGTKSAFPDGLFTVVDLPLFCAEL
jgi:hypothetical protein